MSPLWTVCFKTLKGFPYLTPSPLDPNLHLRGDPDGSRILRLSYSTPVNPSSVGVRTRNGRPKSNRSK